MEPLIVFVRLGFGGAEKGEGHLKTLLRTPPAWCDRAEKGAKDWSTLYLKAYEKDIDLKTKTPQKNSAVLRFSTQKLPDSEGQEFKPDVEFQSFLHRPVLAVCVRAQMSRGSVRTCVRNCSMYSLIRVKLT